MLAGISAAKLGHETVIIEKMNACGKKLRITGKGRCNITNNIDISEFIKNIPGNGKFLYSTFQRFTNKDILNILYEEGLKTKVERGNRIFPITDNAQSVIEALLNCLKKLKVKIITNSKVTDIIVKEGKAIGVKYLNNNSVKEMLGDKIILASRRCKLPKYRLSW